MKFFFKRLARDGAAPAASQRQAMPKPPSEDEVVRKETILERY